jgi:hypothetical protein
LSLHAGFVVYARLSPARHEVVRHERLVPVEIALIADSVEVREPEHDVAALVAPREPAATLDRVATDHGSPKARDELITDVPAPEATPEVAVEPPSAGSAAPDNSVPRGTMSLDALGVGNNPFLGMKGLGLEQRAAAPPPASSSEVPDRVHVAEQRVKQYLIAGMLEHDRTTGAARGGAVVSALHDAAMLISSPLNGQAEFIATVDATGLVIGLRATRVSSNAADWRNVAVRALGKLAKKRIHVPAGAQGLEVRLALSSKIQLPSGSGGVATQKIPLMNADGTKLSRLELPPESRNLPDPNNPAALGTPAVQQAIPGGGLVGDLADIGQTERRVVRVTITEERPM